MPRISKALVAVGAHPVQPEGSGGVIGVERTVRLLGAFVGAEATLTLTQISERAGLNKSTALRFARTLEWAGYLVQLDDRSWRLGPAAGWLGASYQRAFDLDDAVMPVLKRLAQVTGHSASFFVRESGTRVCVFRVERHEDTRPSIRPGTGFPLDRGAAGRVILAYSGRAGTSYEAIRKRGYCIGIDERATGDASVAAPVFGANWQLIGAVSVSDSARRLSQDSLEGMAKHVVQAARRASSALGGRYVRLSKSA